MKQTIVIQKYCTHRFDNPLFASMLSEAVLNLALNIWEMLLSLVNKTCHCHSKTLSRNWISFVTIGWAIAKLVSSHGPGIGVATVDLINNSNSFRPLTLIIAPMLPTYDIKRWKPPRSTTILLNYKITCFYQVLQ